MINKIAEINQLMVDAGAKIDELSGFINYDQFNHEQFTESLLRAAVLRARQCPIVRAVDAEDVAQHIETSFGLRS